MSPRAHDYPVTVRHFYRGTAAPGEPPVAGAPCAACGQAKGAAIHLKKPIDTPRAKKRRRPRRRAA